MKPLIKNKIKIIITILVGMLCLLYTITGAFADTYFNGTFTPTINNVTYYTSSLGLTGVTSLNLGTICLNITGGNYEQNHCTVYTNNVNKTLCYLDTECLDIEYCSNKLCELIPTAGGTSSGDTGYKNDTKLVVEDDDGKNFIQRMIDWLITDLNDKIKSFNGFVGMTIDDKINTITNAWYYIVPMFLFVIWVLLLLDEKKDNKG